MICDNCKIDKLVTDFINNQKYCYQCEYQRKLTNSPKIRTRRLNYCRVCGAEVVHQNNLKKRQRTVFCSQKCALLGHKELSNNHWTRQVRSGRVA